MLPGFNNVQGLWPAVWAMGNLGRAGYGASLDGMVSVAVPALGSSGAELTVMPCAISGRIPTTRATSARRRTRPSTACPCLRQSMATRGMAVCCPSCPASGFRAALVPASRTLAPCTTTASMSDAPRLKLTCLKLRFVMATFWGGSRYSPRRAGRWCRYTRQNRSRITIRAVGREYRRSLRV